VHDNTRADERVLTITTEMLLALGPENLAFVKRIEVEGTIGYAICANDGTQLGLAPSRDVAFAAARQYDLEPVSVH